MNDPMIGQKQLSFLKGEELYKQGSTFEGLYLIKAGAVKVTMKDKEANDSIVRICGPGEVLDHSILLGHRTHLCSAIALGPSVCDFFDKDFCLQEIQTNISFVTFLARHTAGLLNDAYERTVANGKKTVKERLVIFLQNLSVSHGNSLHETMQINLRLSREEMASYLGTTPETVIRVMTEMKGMEIIREENRKIVILDPEKLQSYGGMTKDNSLN